MADPITVKVNRRHQITLPRVVCERLNIQPGDRLLVEVRDGAVLLVPQSEEYLQRPGEPHEVRERTTTAYETAEKQAGSHAVTLTLHDEQWRYLEAQAEATGKSVEQVLAQALEEWIAWRRALEEDPIRGLFGAAKTGDKTTSERVDDIVYTLP
jgi:AbrB family looped-hinge helix DNA binding protein